MQKHLNILGTRGVPAAHSGYEYFAAHIGPWLVERGWTVAIYCQDDPGSGFANGAEDDWRGVTRVHYTPRLSGTPGTMEFDAWSIRNVMKRPGVDLVLGYNTAAFNLAERLRGRKVVMNMDGIEWKREKWSFPAKAWFFLNEFAGANLSNLLIADHPEIERHLQPKTRRPIAMIPYGADAVDHMPTDPLEALGVERDRYLVKIGRTVPENSILEIIRAFSRKPRDMKLVVLGNFMPDNRYHVACRDAASAGVLFPGAIFDKTIVQPLRFHARAYLHGHTVGGTNPSLCEALGAGNAVIAHGNRFNRWVAGPEQLYFEDEDSCELAIEAAIADDTRIMSARTAARQRHAEAFTWPIVLSAYEDALSTML